MMTPTEKVTSNAQAFLGDAHEVALALRVEWGEGATAIGGTEGFLRTAVAAPTSLSLLAYPLVALQKRLWTRKRLRTDPNAGCGILALTAGDGRILLSASTWRRKTPTGIVDVLPEATALRPDVELMETYLVSALTVGQRELLVDNVDFKQLIEAVRAGTVVSRVFEGELDRLERIYFNRFALD